jgi:hypothetical protein
MAKGTGSQYQHVYQLCNVAFFKHVNADEKCDSCISNPCVHKNPTAPRIFRSPEFSLTIIILQSIAKSTRIYCRNWREFDRRADIAGLYLVK